MYEMLPHELPQMMESGLPAADTSSILPSSPPWITNNCICYVQGDGVGLHVVHKDSNFGCSSPQAPTGRELLVSHAPWKFIQVGYNWWMKYVFPM